MIKIEQPAQAQVLAKHPKALDTVFLFESPSDFEAQARALTASRMMEHRHADDWTNYKTTAQAIDMISAGDSAGLAHSDELLEKLEHLLQIKSSRYRMVDDVAGSLPNIPAYLAGHPMAMRRRQKTAMEQAPLTVTVDLTCSQGINVLDLQKRGACILAFVRAMAARRAVRLYFAVSGRTDTSNNGMHLLCPIDTTPLDVARAGYFLANPALPRALGYRLATALMGQSYHGSSFNYGDMKLHRETQAAIYKSILGDEVFSIPPVISTDDSLKDPEAWLAKYLAIYGGDLVQNEAA
jgi:hypothetical protein